MDAAALAKGLVGGLVVTDDASGILTKERLMKAGDSMIQATSHSIIAHARSGSGQNRVARGLEDAGAGHKSDRLELSSTALENMQASESGVRSDLVQKIRGEIAAGTYLTDEKLEAVVDRLHRELFH